jgi:hypothetical protein
MNGVSSRIERETRPLGITLLSYAVPRFGCVLNSHLLYMGSAKYILLFPSLPLPPPPPCLQRIHAGSILSCHTSQQAANSFNGIFNFDRANAV